MGLNERSHAERQHQTHSLMVKKATKEALAAAFLERTRQKQRSGKSGWVDPHARLTSVETAWLVLLFDYLSRGEDRKRDLQSKKEWDPRSHLPGSRRFIFLGKAGPPSPRFFFFAFLVSFPPQVAFFDCLLLVLVWRFSFDVKKR